MTGKHALLTVGTLRVTHATAEMLIAVVENDGLTQPFSPSRRAGLNRGRDNRMAVSIGDRARILRVPTKSKPKSPTLESADLSGLKKERDQLVRDVAKRNRKSRPYRRRVIRWDL